MGFIIVGSDDGVLYMVRNHVIVQQMLQINTSAYVIYIECINNILSTLWFASFVLFALSRHVISSSV